MPHFWPSVFTSTAVKHFVAKPARVQRFEKSAGFTITTANPDESAGLRGIRIVELQVPGRYALSIHESKRDADSPEA